MFYKIILICLIFLLKVWSFDLHSIPIEKTLEDARRIVANGLPEELYLAEDNYNKIIDHSPMNSDAFIELAELIVFQIKLGLKPLKLIEKASLLINHAQALDPKRPAAKYALAELLFTLEKQHDGEKLFESIRKKYPTHLDTYVYTCRIMFDKKPELAIENAQLALKQGASIERITPFIAFSFKLLEGYPDNLHAFSKKYKNRWLSHYLGMEYDDLGLIKKAMTHFSHAVRLGNNVESRLHLAILQYEHSNHVSKAIGNFKHIIRHLKKFPHHRKSSLALINTHISAALLKQNKHNDALKYAYKALGTNSINHDILRFLIDEFKKSGNIELAKSIILKYTHENPMDPNNHAELAKLLEHKGNYKNALKSISKAIILDSDNDSYYAYAAAINSKFKNYELALKNYKKAIDLNPLSENYHYSAASILSLKGMYTESMRYLKNALHINKDLVKIILKDPNFKFIKNNQSLKDDLYKTTHLYQDKKNIKTKGSHFP